MKIMSAIVMCYGVEFAVIVTKISVVIVVVKVDDSFVNFNVIVATWNQMTYVYDFWQSEQFCYEWFYKLYTVWCF